MYYIKYIHSCVCQTLSCICTTKFYMCTDIDQHISLLDEADVHDSKNG